MTAGDDGLAARALQNDEFGRMIRGEGACSRWVAKRPPATYPDTPHWQVCDCCAAEREQAPSPQKPSTSGLGIQSSSAFTDLGDNRRLRRLRFTLLRWLTRLGPRAMATPIARTSITTRWAMREVSGV